MYNDGYFKPMEIQVDNQNDIMPLPTGVCCPGVQVNLRESKLEVKVEKQSVYRGRPSGTDVMVDASYVPCTAEMSDLRGDK